MNREPEPIRRAHEETEIPLAIRVMEDISARVTVGMNQADKMRTQLYLLDIIDVVKKSTPESKDEELLAKIKRGPGFLNLDTVLIVPDETTLGFMSEVKEKLSNKPQS